MQYQHQISLTLVVMLCALVNEAANIHHNIRREYNKHVARVEKYQRETSCSVPKETLVQISEINFSRPILANQKISPGITVLHRCESCSGCPLEPGYSCTAKTSEEVTQTFFILEGKTGHAEYVKGTASNHTSCWCQPTVSQPK